MRELFGVNWSLLFFLPFRGTKQWQIIILVMPSLFSFLLFFSFSFFFLIKECFSCVTTGQLKNKGASWELKRAGVYIQREYQMKALRHYLLNHSDVYFLQQFFVSFFFFICLERAVLNILENPVGCWGMLIVGLDFETRYCSVHTTFLL